MEQVRTASGKRGKVVGSGNGFFQIALRGTHATLKLRGTELSLDTDGPDTTAGARAYDACGINRPF